MYFFKGIYQKSKILFWLFLSIILVLPVLSLLDIVLLKDEFSHIAFSDLTSPIYNLLATVALFFAAYYSRKISKRLYWGWLFLAIGQFSFTLGDIIWAVIELVLKIQLFPSIADAFYLLYYLLFLIGIIILPVKRLGSLEWFKRTLDVLIVMVVAILVDWIFIINPILKQGIGTSVLETIISIAYPVGDLLLMCALLIIIYYRSEHISIGSLVILGTSLIFTIIADSIYSHQSLLGIYSSGEILAYGWKISYVLVGLAAFSQIFSLELEKERDWLTDHILFRSEWVRRGVIIFPYFWVIGSYALLLGYYNQGSPINSYIISSGVGCILIFVIVRQIMASNENEHHLITIRNTLEQVNLQASELDRSNQKLRLEIIERNRVEDKLTHSKLHDALTGLVNRDLFMDRLCHVVELSKRESNHFYSILFIDLDNFKTINDGFGQTTGDLALIEFGKRLIACTREPDTIARVSGDEFVILIESDLDENIGLKVAERIFNELLRPFHLINDKEIFLTCSIGIVHGISEYFNPEDLLRDANLAMYAAKDKGKAQTQIYNLSIGLPAFARFEIEGDMRTAIEKCEFYLDYQPIFSLAENKIVGMEALVR